MQWLTIEITGEQRRAHHWYLCRGLQGWLHGPEQACPEVNAFLIERCYTAVFMREPTGRAIDAVVVYRLDEEKVTRHFGARLLEATTKKDPLYLFFYYSSVLVQRSYFICFTSLTLSCSFVIISCPLGVCSIKALLPNLENHG